MKLDGGRAGCNTLWRLTLDWRTENRHGRLWTQRQIRKTTDNTYTPQTPELLLAIQGSTDMFKSQTRWVQSTAQTNQNLKSPLLQTQVSKKICFIKAYNIFLTLDMQNPPIMARLSVTLRTAFTLYHLLPIHFCTVERWTVDVFVWASKCFPH